jgi:hypothetical protein
MQDFCKQTSAPPQACLAVHHDEQKMVLVFRDVDPEPLKYTGLYLKLKGN